MLCCSQFRIGGWATVSHETFMLRSDQFYACGQMWSLIVYPRGNKKGGQGGMLSVYLRSTSNMATLATFEISAVHPGNTAETVSKSTEYLFFPDDTCGWAVFMPLAQLGGFIAHDGSMLFRSRISLSAVTALNALNALNALTIPTVMT